MYLIVFILKITKKGVFFFSFVYVIEKILRKCYQFKDDIYGTSLNA